MFDVFHSDTSFTPVVLVSSCLVKNCADLVSCLFQPFFFSFLFFLFFFFFLGVEGGGGGGRVVIFSERRELPLFDCFSL